MGKNWRITYNQYKNIFWNNFNYYKEKESFRNFVELILTLIAIIVFSVFALKPTAITIIELNKEIKAKENTIKAMDSKIKDLQKAQMLLSQKQEIIELINIALPSGADPEIAMRQTEAALITSGSEINQISITEVPLTSTTKTNTEKANLPNNTSAFGEGFLLKGSYTSVTKALETIENLRRIVIFDQVSLSKSNKEETSELVNLNVSIRFPYHLPNEKNKESSSQQEKKVIEKNKKE